MQINEKEYEKKFGRLDAAVAPRLKHHTMRDGKRHHAKTKFRLIPKLQNTMREGIA